MPPPRRRIHTLRGASVQLQAAVCGHPIDLRGIRAIDIKLDHKDDESLSKEQDNTRRTEEIPTITKT